MTDQDTARLQDAMARWAGGHEDSLGQVYDVAAPPLFRFLLRLARDRALAEDLTHDTFLRLHAARGLYRVGAPVMPWVYAIARRLFLETVRSQKREAVRLGTRVDADDPGVESRMGPGPWQADDLLSTNEMRAQVERVLARLPESQLTAFLLLKQEGLSITEAAAVVGVTETSIKLRAHRAYTALREALGEPRASASEPGGADLSGTTA